MADLKTVPNLKAVKYILALAKYIIRWLRGNKKILWTNMLFCKCVPPINLLSNLDGRVDIANYSQISNCKN